MSSLPPKDYEVWQQYWAAQGWPWRQEPEIPQVRQEELAQRRMTQVDIKQGIYPFRGMVLTRADIEWLLVTHDDGQGPVEWSDEQQQRRRGLDLRGAYVSEEADLGKLPLTRLHGGLSFQERFILHTAPPFLCLRRVTLMGVRLQEAVLRYAHLEEAILRYAHLERAVLWEAHLEGAVLIGAYLQEADLRGAHLEKADLRGASCPQVNLFDTILVDGDGVGPSLADVRWGETNLSVVDWSQIQMLGDERSARQRETIDGKKKERATRQKEYQAAHRANHQLMAVLQDQGLVDDASRFAYRAKCLKRITLWYDLLLAKTIKQRIQIGWSLLFSWMLFLLAGYGYRLRRCLFWYIGVVLAFTLLYWWSDPTHLPWWVALGESVNVFHGRGASPTITALAHPVRFTLLTVMEAMIGLVIEVIFVATVIQRLFGK